MFKDQKREVSDTGVAFRDNRLHIKSDAPRMVQRVIKYSGGLIKNENQASILLGIFAVLAIYISLRLFLGSVEAEQEQYNYPIVADPSEST